MHNLTTAQLCAFVTILTKKPYHEQIRKSPRSNKGEQPKYYTNYAEDKSSAPTKMLGVGGQKKIHVGGGAKNRVVDSSSNESSADTGNKRGITSKKARGVAMSKEGSSFSSRATKMVGKDKVGKEQRKLERHLGYDYTSSSGDLIPEATVYKSAEEEIKRSRQDLLKIIDEKDKNPSQKWPTDITGESFGRSTNGLGRKQTLPKWLITSARISFFQGTSSSRTDGRMSCQRGRRACTCFVCKN
jgi:hypothetical protein